MKLNIIKPETEKNIFNKKYYVFYSACCKIILSISILIPRDTRFENSKDIGDFINVNRSYAILGFYKYKEIHKYTIQN